MDDLDGWARALAAVAADAVADQPRRICDLCVSELDVTGAGISMVTTAGNRAAVCATDGTAERIEQLQLMLGEGPCVDSVHSGAPVLVDDLSAPDGLSVERWPAFMKGAGEEGVKAVFAFPLRIGALNVGAMDLYRDTSGELTTTDFSAALMAADVAALSLLTLDTARFDLAVDDFDAHSAFQRQVHQATGMVQVQLAVTIDEAFLALRARAFATNRSLTDLSADVVARKVRFSAEDT